MLEQDTDLGAGGPPVGAGPIDDVRASVDFLRDVLAGKRPRGRGVTVDPRPTSARCKHRDEGGTMT